MARLAVAKLTLTFDLEDSTESYAGLVTEVMSKKFHRKHTEYMIQDVELPDEKTRVVTILVGVD